MNYTTAMLDPFPTRNSTHLTESFEGVSWHNFFFVRNWFWSYLGHHHISIFFTSSMVLSISGLPWKLLSILPILCSNLCLHLLAVTSPEDTAEKCRSLFLSKQTGGAWDLYWWHIVTPLHFIGPNIDRLKKSVLFISVA